MILLIYTYFPETATEYGLVPTPVLLVATSTGLNPPPSVLSIFPMTRNAVCPFVVASVVVPWKRFPYSRDEVVVPMSNLPAWSKVSKVAPDDDATRRGLSEPED